MNFFKSPRVSLILWDRWLELSTFMFQNLFLLMKLKMKLNFMLQVEELTCLKTQSKTHIDNDTIKTKQQ